MNRLKDLARRASRWLGQRGRTKPSAGTTAAGHRAATSAIEADRFDQMTWDETWAAAPALRELADDLAERYDYAIDLLRDVFWSAYKAAPHVRAAAAMDTGHLVNHTVLAAMLQAPEFENLRRETVGDQYASAMAVLAQSNELRDLLERTRATQEAATKAAQTRRTADQAGRDAADRLDQLADTLDVSLDGQVDTWADDQGKDLTPDLGPDVTDEQAEAVEAALAAAEAADQAASAAELQALQALGAAAGTLRAGARRAVVASADTVSADAALMRAWGLGKGQLQRMGFEQRAALAQRLQSGRLAAYTDLIGRFRAMATGERTRRVENVPGELVGITLGDDLSRLVPAESANLGTPVLRAVFAARLAEQRLMLYDTRGDDRLGRGAIIACIDCSTSMADRYGGATGEAWAKACALALLDQAHAAGRDFAGILFSSRGRHQTFRFPGHQPLDIGDVIDLCETFLGGGTDFEGPLTAATDLLEAEYSATGSQRGDIVFITDGESKVSEDWMRHWNDCKHTLDFRVFGVATGPKATRFTRPGSVLDALCDNLRTVPDLTDPHITADLFHTI
ncbi:MAG TPA: VWA domain-containing protein [Kribbella sp.]